MNLRGGVEMPAFDSQLNEADMEWLAAFVVSAIAQ